MRQYDFSIRQSQVLGNDNVQGNTSQLTAPNRFNQPRMKIHNYGGNRNTDARHTDEKSKCTAYRTDSKDKTGEQTFGSRNDYWVSIPDKVKVPEFVKPVNNNRQLMSSRENMMVDSNNSIWQNSRHPDVRHNKGTYNNESNGVGAEKFYQHQNHNSNELKLKNYSNAKSENKNFGNQNNFRQDNQSNSGDSKSSKLADAVKYDSESVTLSGNEFCDKESDELIGSCSKHPKADYSVNRQCDNSNSKDLCKKSSSSNDEILMIFLLLMLSGEKSNNWLLLAVLYIFL